MTSINDSRADEGTDEARGFTDDREQREEQEFFTSWGHLRDHDLRVRVPRTHKEAIDGLIQPELPGIVVTEALRPDADHTPTVQHNYSDNNGIEHCLRAQLESLLYPPKAEDSNSLCCYPDQE